MPHAHAHAHTHARMHTHAHTHTRACARIHTRTHTHARTHTHTHTHAYMRMCAHTHVSQDALDGRRRCYASDDPEERRKRAMKDPEVQAILADPAMQMILQQMQKDPGAIRE